MSAPQPDLLDKLAGFARSRGIDVRARRMDVEKPGEFDGLSITLNPIHDQQALAFYFAHALGSIYQWSTDSGHAQKVFDALRMAKEASPPPSRRFDDALTGWRLFEQTSSDHAVWVLAYLGHDEAIDPYTVFFRADLEAMTIFHRTGKEPRWPDFFADWKRKVASGEVRIEPFQPRAVGPFTPVKIEKQEVVQEREK